jgi:hypothetical protein
MRKQCMMSWFYRIDCHSRVKTLNTVGSFVDTGTQQYCLKH